MESQYVSLDFVLASTAEIERLWSLAKYILVQQRRRMSPKIFEALLFLKYNRRFWDGKLVLEAYTNAKNKIRTGRMAKIARELEEDEPAVQEATTEPTTEATDDVAETE